MSAWKDQAKANLLKFSKSEIFADAMREWVFTYAYEDIGSPVGTCELCTYSGIRHKFEIENKYTKTHIWVGSECITKFVPIYSGDVEVTCETEKAELVAQITAGLKRDARQERAFSLLSALAANDEAFDKPSWKKNWKLGYSVKQMQMIAVAARKRRLPFNSADFRINTRKSSNVSQLSELEAWQYRKLRGALPATRQKEFDQVFG